MASIEISNLHPVGSNLFNDSESYLNELSDREMLGLEGGILGALGGTLAGLIPAEGLLGYGSLNVTGPDSVQNVTGLDFLAGLLGGGSKGT
ncbi:hypothetical protein F7734_18750 [Scytonema sp. UIC 10036]|uniref:hypothetical protein n=1 Tax=Scytonema sp. UIC 10036 TaxID=2304196 RepID=UPI0012DA5C44|nr:hypothetical protein [Scytonema sp. UIC 10036]MUG94307.1 hypothetical protein [Scytonema sp. UIC 10036]